MAGHFQHVLATSDLTRFIPFAIFVCAVSFLVFIILLASSFFLRERNPISTRIELVFLGFAGFLWLVLGVFLATSASQSAEVDCFASSSDVVPLDASVASFHTEQYQAMYRVLMNFSVVNAMFVLSAFFTLLILAIRRHRMGDEHMWYGPVTSCAWFNNYEKSKPILPTRRKDRTDRGWKANPVDKYTAGVPHRARHMRYSSGGTSYLGSTFTSREFDDGKMINPNKPRRMK
jgi:hypothetical protein